MPQTPHIERHFTSSEVVRDIVIGMSDGLTVPFALAAGLTGTKTINTAIIVTAGLAEIAAVLSRWVGWLSCREERCGALCEGARTGEERSCRDSARRDARSGRSVSSLRLTEDETWPIVQALRRQPKNWIDFMMRFELGLEKPDPKTDTCKSVRHCDAVVRGA